MSENSKARVAVDDLANVVNIATKDIKLHSTLVPMFNKVADDNLVSPVDSAIALSIIKVEIITPTATAVIAAANTTFLVASSIADVAAITAPPPVKIMLPTLADDDLTSIGKVITDSSSKIPKSGFAIDNLANIANIFTKTVRPCTVSTSTVSMITDDNLVFNAHDIIKLFSMKVALPWRYAMRTNHGIATTTTLIWRTAKPLWNPTLMGNVTNGIVDAAQAVQLFSIVKVDMNIADNNPSIAVPIYTGFQDWHVRTTKRTIFSYSAR